jgi:hypothetical protein
VAYRRVNLPVTYLGDSASQRPVATAVEGIVEGSVAVESDTGAAWKYHLGQWVRQRDEGAEAVRQAADLQAGQLAALLRIENLLTLLLAAGD